MALAWVGLAGCGEPERARRHARPSLPVDASGTAELSLRSGQSLRIRAVSSRFGCAPQLHLWDDAAGRAVAAAGPPWVGYASELEYVNPHPSARTYTLLYETSRARRAALELWRDGRAWLQAQSAAVRLPVPEGTLQLASVPGGGRKFRLFALDCEGRLRRVVRDGGPTGLPRLAGMDDLCHVVISTEPNEPPSRVSVYANDPDDRDGDGLGRLLERALRTCDGPDEPGCASRRLADYYAAGKGTRDSDRDGLSDGDEVLGAGPLLDLPRYGASPLHKDVFVEIDHSRNLRDVGFREDELAAIAALYAAGSARALKNPDGRPGVALHFDAGFAPADPQHHALVGDWGGSGRTTANNYRSARDRDFTRERTGYFRYAYITRRGRGQARRDSFTVNRELQRVSIFAHELGHTLGVAHHGHDGWGRANCKPHYFSLMNYVYQNREGVGFSRSAGLVLDPSAVLETLPLDERLPAPEVLRDAPLELDVLDGGVDWNRDGVVSREPVRAGLTWATYKSCGTAGHVRTTLIDSQLMATTPALARLGERLYALFVLDDGTLHVRHGRVSGPDARGSCPEGDAADGGCTRWSMQSLVFGLPPIRHMAVAPWTRDEVLLGYVRPDGQLRVAVLAARGEVVQVRSDVEVAGAASDHAPALARARVAAFRHGSGELLRVWFRAREPEGRLMQASALGPDGPFRIDPVLDDREQPIAVGLAPSVLELGTGELCGAFPDPEGYVRFHCYDAPSDAWVDLTRTAFFAASGPKTAGPVGLAFHRYRYADGRVVAGDATRGAVFLSFTEAESPDAVRPDMPSYFVSESVHAAQPARTHLYFRWRGSVIDEWTSLAPGTGLALYEDADLSALKGLMLVQTSTPEGSKLDFLPFADGVYAAQLGSGDDFELMERGICTRLKGDAWCDGRE